MGVTVGFKVWDRFELTRFLLKEELFGIKNTATMRKVRAWLDKRGVEYVFHDYKTAGIERERLERWEKKVGWETPRAAAKSGRQPRSA